MKSLKNLWVLCCVAALAACGGGGGSAGTPPFGGSDGTSTVSDLVVTPSLTQIQNTTNASVTVTVTAVNSTRNAVADAPVVISADNSAIVVAGAATTDSNGQVTATVSIGASRSNRDITITATSGSISASTVVHVTGTTLTSTLVPAVVQPSAAAQVQYILKDASGSLMADVDITVTAAGLTPSSVTGKTGANGDFVFNYTAPATTGSYSINAVAGGDDDAQTLLVQPISTVPAVTATISSASVSANPSVVPVNTVGSSNNRSEIRALFLGSSNLPIPNVRVKFDLAGDANSIGGTFTTGTTTLYSDANGVVTTAYVPGTRSSPTDGVTIRACYGTTDTDPNLDTCTTFATTHLTVTSEALGVSIGTDGLIIDNDLSYIRRYLVSVADSSGAAKAGVDLAVSLDLVFYRKGAYTTATVWTRGETAICANEDVNRNGVMDAGDDINNSLRLEPGKSDVLVSLMQSKTRDDGTAVVQIQYAKSFATWVDALITVSASGVSGTEGRATYFEAPVPAAADDIKEVDSRPAFYVSPYGVVGSCTDPN